MCCSGLAGAEVVYAEGWCLAEGGRVLEHAWLEIENKIVDPTFPEARMSYFPVLKLRPPEFAEKLTVYGELPLMWQDECIEKYMDVQRCALKEQERRTAGGFS